MLHLKKFPVCFEAGINKVINQVVLYILHPTQGLSESKLRAFDIGNMSLTKSLSKREQEEMKRKVRFTFIYYSGL